MLFRSTFRYWSFSLLFGIYSCTDSSTDSSSSFLFIEQDSDRTGIDFSNDLSESEDFNIIEYLYYYNGGGVAVGDIDGDGFQDIYFSSNERDNGLYLNEGNLKFRNITKSAGVASSGPWKTGVSIADVNNDGMLDIYLTRVSGYKGLYGHNELYMNNGDRTFTEASAQWGIDFQGFSTHSGFFDMDNDGDLDMYLLNHSVHTPSSFGNASLRLKTDSTSGDRLFENVGDRFIDVTSQAGLYSSSLGYGLGLSFSDINGDGFTDIYVSNDFSENDYLYLNNGDKTFTESLEKMANRTSRFSMGNDLADVNNDGSVDIMTLDMMPEDEEVRKRSAGEDSYEVYQARKSLGYMDQYGRNSLLVNSGDGRFMDVAMMTGVHATDWSWSTLMADYDLDGRKDIFISNGIWKRPNDLDFIDFISSNLARDPNLTDADFTERMPSGEVPNYFFKNTGGWTFENKSGKWMPSKPGVTNGATYADLDADGDLDIVLNNLNTRASILENRKSNQDNSNYLSISLISTNPDINVVGTTIESWTDGKSQFHEYYLNRGFQSSVHAPVIIGLGNSQNVDSLIIKRGHVTLKMYDIKSNQRIQIDLNDGKIFNDEIKTKSNKFTKSGDDFGVSFRHEENRFWEFTREALIPHMNAYEGPALTIGDVNGDGKEDIFIGGAKRQPSVLYLQGEDGFKLSDQFGRDSTFEDVDAAFLDVENDGDLDLFVVSGGNDFTGENENRQPRIYLNDGLGNFTRNTTMLPPIYHTGSVCAAHDYDGDGYIDIFLGSLAKPWNYGISPESYLLKNIGGKKFENVTSTVKELQYTGMVKDAAWADLDQNGERDLIVASLWQPIKVYYSRDGKLEAGSGIHNEKGWWQVVKPVDYDDDGDIDLLLGNLGLNTKLKASKDEPVRLYIDDLDGNKQLDHILTYYRDGKESVFANKKDLAKPLTFVNRRYRDFESFANAKVGDIFGQKNLDQAQVLEATEFQSGILENKNGSFFFTPFSMEAQTSMVRTILFDDLDNDGQQDLLLSGNFSYSTLQDAPYTENYGTYYRIKNGLEYVPNGISGIYFEGEVVHIANVNIGDKQVLLVVKNDDPVEWWVK